jgi:hypothetical protein
MDGHVSKALLLLHAFVVPLARPFVVRLLLDARAKRTSSLLPFARLVAASESRKNGRQ